MGIIIFSVLAVFLIPTALYDDMRSIPSNFILPLLLFAAICLISIPIMLLFVIGIQYINPLSDKYWSKPTHDANPFCFGNPLFFFHFGAYQMLAVGVGSFISALWHGWPALLHGIFLLLGSLMFLVGIHACVHCYHKKFLETSEPSKLSGSPAL